MTAAARRGLWLLPMTGSALAQAAIVIQASLVFSVQPLLLAIGLAVVGYLLLRSTAAAKAFGGLALALALVFAIAFPLRELAPALGGFETVAGVGVLLWAAALSVALLMPRPFALPGRGQPLPAQAGID